MIPSPPLKRIRPNATPPSPPTPPTPNPSTSRQGDLPSATQPLSTAGGLKIPQVYAHMASVAILLTCYRTYCPSVASLCTRWNRAHDSHVWGSSLRSPRPTHTTNLKLVSTSTICFALTNMPVDFIEFEITDLTGSYLVEIGKVDKDLLPLNIQKGDVACIGQCQVLWHSLVHFPP